MIKQWKNVNLGVTYFFIPNSKNNEILTEDGVLIPYSDFKSMNMEKYNSIKNTNGGYDYALSKQSERLVKKIASSNDFATSTSSKINKMDAETLQLKEEVEKAKELQKKVAEESKVKTIKKPLSISKENTEVESSTKPIVKSDVKNTKNNEIESPKKIENKEDKLVTKKRFNLFDFAYPKLTLIIVIICSCLSIYFTGTYMQRLQSVFIAYAISSAILIYGIIGMQIARRSWKEKKYFQSFMFGITAISVLIFSMFSAVDVNYAKFKESHLEIEETYNVNDGKKISYELMKDELAENKKQIDLLNEDIKFQQTQWVLAWDNEKKQNVLLEGRISATAQQKITDDNIRIDELNKRNKEINQELREYAESGISVEHTESKTERAKSLTDLIGALLGISGNVIQLIILLIPSIFTDLINILGTTIYCQKFEDKD